ncbi:MAG: AAA family ATPase [Anaerovoracaceae bacterium]
MLLRSLKMMDFRQFKNESITFATDSEKNVTIIMGENGAGKTTISQAFSWCLYGDTDFDDKIMLNKITSAAMKPGEKKSVLVELELTHAGTDYTITTEQVYEKDYSNKLKASQVVRNISQKRNGQQEFAKPLEIEVLIKEILPKELSKYFFFDGERIGNMSKEIRKGKSQTFATAVRGLLGLNAIQAGIDHLKPTSKYAVIGSYDDRYNTKSDSRIAKYNDDIREYQEKLEKIESRLPDIDNEIQLASDRIEVLADKIRQSQDGEKLQKAKTDLQRKIASSLQSKLNAAETMVKTFSKNSSSYFSKSMIKKSLELLSQGNYLEKDIPAMHAKTIDYLLKRGMCICGTKLEVGSQPYDELIKLLEYIPPKSIGTMVGQFVRESELNAKSGTELFDDYSKSFSVVVGLENSIKEMQNDITLIEKQLEGYKGIGHFQQELSLCERAVREKTNEKIELLANQKVILQSQDRLKTERATLAIQDEQNRKIEVYKAYAQYMYDELTNVYQQSETTIRTKLETTINDIFKDIYNGGLSLSIDEKYQIQVNVDEFNDNDVETSTAQSISVIFAFITGVIKLARESRESDSSENNLLAAEPYPLVMDAPLSSFDKRRIKTVCEALPKVAEQVIVFIKDTDGEIAEEHMSSKIGKRYEFDKNNEFETKLVRR